VAAEPPVAFSELESVCLEIGMVMLSPGQRSALVVLSDLGEEEVDLSKCCGFWGRVSF
jgi:hypothetical protein